MATKSTPQFPPGQDMTDVSPEDVADAKRRAKESAAYDKSLRVTPPAPKASEPVRKAKGGVTRADGCVTKGHTRGKMV